MFRINIPAMTATHEISRRTRKGNQDGVSPQIFEISHVYGDRFRPAEIEEEEANSAKRIDVGDGIEGKPPHLFCRRVP